MSAASPLSIWVIVRSHARSLRRGLESLEPLADEIVVLDASSEESVSEIAAEFGARVQRFPPGPDHEALLRAGVRNASGGWVLVLEANEELGSGSPEAIRRFLERSETEPGYVQVRYLLSSPPDGTGRPSAPSAESRPLCLYQPRLFRADGERPKEPVLHGNFVGEPLPEVRPGSLAPLILDNHDRADDGEPCRGGLAELDAQTRSRLKRAPKDLKAHFARALFLRLALQEPDAAESFIEALRLGDVQNRDHQPYILMSAFQFAVLAARGDAPEQVEKYCSAVLNLDECYLDPWLPLGEAYFLREQFWRAEQCLRRYGRLLRQIQAKGTPLAFGEVPSARCPLHELDREARANFLLARLAEFRLDSGSARGLYEAGLRLDPGNWKPYYRLGRLLESGGDTARAQSLMAQARALEPNLDQCSKALEVIPSEERRAAAGAPLPSPAPTVSSSREDRSASLIEYRPRYTSMTAAEIDTLSRDCLVPVAGIFEGCRRVLDVSCGPGTLLRRLQERKVDGFGIDDDPKFVELCQYRGLNAAVTSPEALAEQGERYDGLYLGHVLERYDLEGAEGLLRTCARMLEPGGTAVIRTANRNHPPVRERFWLDKRHVRFYAPEEIHRLLERTGLKCFHQAEEQYGTQDLLVVAKAPEAGPAARPSPALRWLGAFFQPIGRCTFSRKLCSALTRRLEGDLELLPVGDERYDFSLHPGHFPELFHRFRPSASAVKDQRSTILITHTPSPSRPPEFAENPWIPVLCGDHSTLPVEWVPALRDEAAEIWVHSDHRREGLIRDGLDPEKIAVVPPGVDETYFHPDADAWAVIDAHTSKLFRFLFVGSVHPRHGFDLLLDAYLEGFSSQDDVCLIIKEIRRPGERPDEACVQRVQEVIQSSDAPALMHIRMMTLGETELAGLYTATDAFVFPYRMADFPLAALEASACGRPVILTRSGVSEELFPASAGVGDSIYWVPGEEKTFSEGVPTVRPVSFLQPSVESLLAQLRHVFEGREEARARARRVSDYVRSRFTWENAAARALERLRKIRGK